MNFCTFWRLKFTKWTKFTALKMAKTAVFALLESPNLISRKFRVIEKSWNFHTVSKILVFTQCAIFTEKGGFLLGRKQAMANVSPHLVMHRFSRRKRVEQFFLIMAFTICHPMQKYVISVASQIYGQRGRLRSYGVCQRPGDFGTILTTQNHSLFIFINRVAFT